MIHVGDFVYEAELRKNELDRVARLARAQGLQRGESSLVEGYRRFLVRVGDLLVTLGCELQTRYMSERRPTACAG
jgi:hypothetical protein